MGRGCVEGVRSHGLRVGQPEWPLLALPQESPGHDLLRKSTRICPGKSSPGRGEEARKKAERAQAGGVTQGDKWKSSRKFPRPGPAPMACTCQLGKYAVIGTAPSPFFQLLKSLHIFRWFPWKGRLGSGAAFISIYSEIPLHGPSAF